MATVSGKNIYLYDKWPGPISSYSKPPGGFDSTKEGSGNCVSVAAFDIGEKRGWRNDSTQNPGVSTFIYLRFVEGSDNAYDTDADVSTGYALCSHIQDCSQHSPDGGTDWYLVTNDCTNSDHTMGGAVAVAMCDFSGNSTTSTNEFGWFWCGGVCPCNTLTDAGGTDMTKTGGEFHTDGNVTIGNPIYGVDDGTNTCGIGHALIDSTKHIHDQVFGRALATDA